MTVTLRGLSTAVPHTVLIQDQVRDVFAAQPGLSRLAQRIVPTSFNVSGIETRHTVIEELTFDDYDGDREFFDPASGELLMPGTKARNEVYIREATKLYVEAGRLALDALDDVAASDVTHVITVSCTGFYAPGPDYMLVRELGLDLAVQRFHLGFMGCYATMPALRLAKQLVDADADAVVLVVTAELCTLHLRSSNDPDTIVASSLFADGAGAGIVSSRMPAPGEVVLGLDRFETVITPVGEADMAWKIGDNGFEMILSTYVPHIIDEHIESAIAPLLAPEPHLVADPAAAVAHWAIHPGGRSILDKVESKLALSEAQLVPARETLRDFGNMSSATIAFVLRNILDNGSAHGDRVLGMAFGPGLTVETGLFTVLEG
ncbi:MULTISPECIES: type III polyketide synthase [unclassified Leifsonia]|uniref:type III polyketide synthase n=1 Tax=unclassified Leifsonia TaxID=2663824 RepID=UPI0006F80578|nr:MULTISPECIES: type III polyketide synthase [unclassified Leifsonia]KQX07510.1 naringenin-chalcone synthase [Leifsonia sp. Root1293]KRA11792.1 naringenin-chalcone synthase [Leifsonia sp. Root60]